MPNARHRRGSVLGAMAEPLARAWTLLGEIPVDILQALFMAVDPLVAMRKFVRFAALADSPAARNFVAVEDWLNDGVPLALPVARECLAGWYGNDTPAQGKWRVAGRPVLAHRVEQPALVIMPENDRIVPPATSEALAAQLPAAERLTLRLGHVGMIVGSTARREVWQPLARWLRRQLRPGSKTG